MGIYSVPAGHTAFITKAVITVSRNDSSDIRLLTRYNADMTTAPFGGTNIRARFLDVQLQQIVDFDAWLEVPEKSDVWFRANHASGGGTSGVSVDFDILLVANHLIQDVD